MINKPERITYAQIADMYSGKQRHISDFVELDAGDIAMGARRVRKALQNHEKRLGGEKI